MHSKSEEPDFQSGNFRVLSLWDILIIVSSFNVFIFKNATWSNFEVDRICPRVHGEWSGVICVNVLYKFNIYPIS